MNDRRRPHRCLLLALGVIAATSTGCSVRSLLVNQLGATLAEGGSTFESEADLTLVEQALPFSLKLLDAMLLESPRHRGLLLASCRSFTAYSYTAVHFEAERAADVDLEEARRLRARARALDLRAHDRALRGLELSHHGLRHRLAVSPESAVSEIEEPEDVPFLHCAATALGLAISVSKGDAFLLGRLPEVEAMVDRGLELDETYDHGALHELRLTLSAATRARHPPEELRRHHARALELSAGRRASAHLAFAEAVALPEQNRDEFRRLLETVLAVDLDAAPELRLTNALAKRRAEWLLGRIEDLFYEPATHDDLEDAP